MPYVLEDLVVNRVDLVDEGANSAAFIELYKRKEQSEMPLNEIISKLKPEHAAVVNEAINKAAEDLKKSQEDLANVTTELEKAKADLTAANEELATANSELEVLKSAKKCSCGKELDENGKCPDCGDVKKTDKFDETETFKSMPKEVRELYEKMKERAEAAEAEVTKAKEAEKNAEAIAKAKELKAIPVEQDTLVGIIKSASPELLDLLKTVNAAIEGTVLTEVGKSHMGSATGGDAWAKIEAKADEIKKRDNVTKEQAISKAIKENPVLYREYLDGGAN